MPIGEGMTIHNTIIIFSRNKRTEVEMLICYLSPVRCLGFGVSQGVTAAGLSVNK